jgi:hypothetical protein
MVAPPMAALPASSASQPASWWKGMLGTTRAANGMATDLGPIDERVARERVAVASAGLGLLMILLALVVGLRDAPSGLLLSPMVAASIVVARGALAVGMLVVGLGFLRAAERVYFR